ncbi:MAG: hypothetical protein EOO47_25870 [Flavobacterium sp.]|nr:MAG: hypothetical protein EOO47_25870 [Flavobacterium sp.]
MPCDLLSEKHDVLFCVAVGKDGTQIGYNRIQTPSDMVNGLAIAACIKIRKPDINAEPEKMDRLLNEDGPGLFNTQPQTMQNHRLKRTGLKGRFKMGQFGYTKIL